MTAGSFDHFQICETSDNAKSIDVLILLFPLA